jgi:sulfonate transport system ATP-binding protein
VESRLRESAGLTAAVLDRIADPSPRASSAGAAVMLRGITKSFGTHDVLRGIDLDIEPGAFVAVVGRSGCGKSTLLRLIAGLDSPDGGSVTVDRPGARLMFQEPRLLPWARVADNVAVGLMHAQNHRERLRNATEALAQVGLAGRERDWPGVLSGGQKQRVALARALVSHPRLLAFDEPLGALDALTRIEMQRLIEEVWQAKGFTAIVVTHDVAEVVTLADRVLLLKSGVIALDVPIALPRPRRRGDARLAAIEGRILERLLGASATRAALE